MNQTDSTIQGYASVPNPVSWQVAWWSLAPMAISTMTQPCGSVLGLPEKYRPWLRSSPIVCAADICHLLLRLHIASIFGQQKFSEILESAMRDRLFENDEPKGIIKKLEDKALFRWLLFIVGGVVCQTIKLGAMQGIPYTKAWAIIFSGSFILGEVIIFVPRLLNTDNISLVPLPNYRWKIVQKSLNGPLLGYLTIHCQYIILGYLSGRVTKLIPPGNWPWWIVGIFSIGPTLLACASHILKRNSGLGSSDKVEVRAPIPLFVLVFFALDVVMFTGTPEMPYYAPEWVGWYVHYLFFYFIAWLCIYMTSWNILNWIGDISCRGLVFLPTPTRAPVNLVMARETDSDIWYDFCEVIFFLNLTFSILYYRFIYDSTGTINPPWTGMFG